MRRSSTLILFSFVGSVFATTVLAQTATAQTKSSRTIAGKTVDQYAQQLNDSDRVIRLRAIRSLGALGDSAGQALNAGLEHDDAAVRYIAAVELGRIGDQPLGQAKPRLKILAADQQSLSVRLAASYALCRAGEVSDHLPLLVTTLGHPIRGVACSAAELIGQIGPDAASAIEAMEVVYQKNQPGTRKGDPHLGGATANALRKLRGENQ